MTKHKVKVIVPITGDTKDKILEEAQVIARTDADVVEWRYDLAKSLYQFNDAGSAGDAMIFSAVEKMQVILSMLLEKMPGKQLLFTIRTRCQGGEFPNIPMAYERLICEAIKTRCVSFVDIEDTTDEKSMKSIMKLATDYDVKTIASYHNFDMTPDFTEIMEKFSGLLATGADIIKTAYMPRSAADVATVLSATAYFKEQEHSGHEMITMAMGSLGKISRVSGAIFGSDYTFASVGETSAPGQMPIETVRNIMSMLGDASSENLYLIGFMASGKSTISAKLHELTGKPVFEMDRYIEEKMGMSITDIFDKFGEERFREIETETLREIRPDSGAIISTGGGAPMRAENREIMSSQGKVVYLSVKPETVIKRLSVNQTDRPVLAGHVNIEYVTELLKKRDPVYRETADVVLETDDMSIEEIYKAIMDLCF
ncbi:type I 3-dehydroquinate dehydratase [Oribacterium sp. WCC10]|uniref:type I 3-dehydroquinate dehydratase n=1 Tax=Oribacterium sp. WCC10 TaxID=1855343 RepID=UPI0008E8E35E|nr:type I 3-dehydroquinate dehydratase [Oribacterium sp. WCC10]SFG25834.1 3-dehydroquinate dehydratase, type I [Oribacterium sp. WCC10]